MRVNVVCIVLSKWLSIWVFSPGRLNTRMFEGASTEEDYCSRIDKTFLCHFLGGCPSQFTNQGTPWGQWEETNSSRVYWIEEKKNAHLTKTINKLYNHIMGSPINVEANWAIGQIWNVTQENKYYWLTKFDALQPTQH